MIKNIIIFLMLISLPVFSSAQDENEFLSKVTLPTIAIFVSIIVLVITYANNRLNNFNNRFNLLLEQHNKLHKFVEENIKANNSDFERIINYNYYQDSVDGLYKDDVYSPYMRMLYHLLKFIDADTPNKYIFMRSNKEKKKYSSVVRSLITNDVMLLVMINSLNSEFTYYRKLLDKFDFFEHISVKKISEIRKKYSEDYYFSVENEKLKMNIKNFFFNFVDSLIFTGDSCNNISKKNRYIFKIDQYWMVRFDLNKVSVGFFSKSNSERSSYYNNSTIQVLKIKIEEEIEACIRELIKEANNYVSSVNEFYYLSYYYFIEGKAIKNQVAITKYKLEKMFLSSSDSYNFESKLFEYIKSYHSMCHYNVNIGVFDVYNNIQNAIISNPYSNDSVVNIYNLLKNEVQFNYISLNENELIYAIKEEINIKLIENSPFLGFNKEFI
ncbi:putative phage abortive infection protein [Providencia alcalifaciens]